MRSPPWAWRASPRPRLPWIAGARPRTTCGAARPRSRPCSRRTARRSIEALAQLLADRQCRARGDSRSRSACLRMRPTRRRSRCGAPPVRPNWSVRSRRCEAARLARDRGQSPAGGGRLRGCRHPRRADGGGGPRGRAAGAAGGRARAADGRGAGRRASLRPRQRRLAAEQTHDRLARELRAGDADGLRERLAIAERELAALEAERRRLDGEIRDLEVALREAGADSWVERLDEIEGALAGARAARRRLELEGRAWRLLAERLGAADQSVREALVAPIGLRLRPLLQRVFPGAEPVLDPDRLSLTHLRRDGAEETLRQPQRRRARAAGRPGPPGLRLPAGRARGRGAVPDPRRCPGLCRRGPVRDHEGDPAAGSPRACRSWCSPAARATISDSTRATCGSRTVGRHRPDAGNSAWTRPAAGVMVRADDEAERMTA